MRSKHSAAPISHVGETRTGYTRIGTGWSILGALMLGAALATPVLLVKLAPLQGLTTEGVAETAAPAPVVEEVAIAIGPSQTGPDVDTMAPAIVEVPHHDPTPPSQVAAAAAGAKDPEVTVGHLVALALPALGAPVAPTAAVPAEGSDAPASASALATVNAEPPEVRRMAQAAPDIPELVSADRTQAKGLVTPYWVQVDGTPPGSATPLMLAGALEEQKLALSPRERRTIQLGLAALGHNPQGADGVFGPNTRAAIQAWETAKGLETDGYIAAEERDVLMKAGAIVVARLEAQRAKSEPVVPTLMPFATQPVARAAPECARDLRGAVIENQSFSCDLVVLREGLSQLFGRRS